MKIRIRKVVKKILKYDIITNKGRCMIMKDCKFKQLILDVYKEWNKQERVYTKEELGYKITYKNFWGTMFGACSRDCFMDITDIQKYMDICNPNMFLLNSRVTSQEVEIYDWQLENYSIQGDNLIIKLKNKEVIFNL
jgi:hypothetical protein